MPIGPPSPVRPDLAVLTCLRITVFPPQWPAVWGDVGRLGLLADVIGDLANVSAVGNERNDAHLPTADRTQKREHLVDAGNQHRPQVVGWALGLRRLSLGWKRTTQRQHSQCKDEVTRTPLKVGCKKDYSFKLS